MTKPVDMNRPTAAEAVLTTAVEVTADDAAQLAPVGASAGGRRTDDDVLLAAVVGSRKGGGGGKKGGRGRKVGVFVSSGVRSPVANGKNSWYYVLKKVTVSSFLFPIIAISLCMSSRLQVCTKRVLIFFTEISVEGNDRTTSCVPGMC